MSVTEQMVIHAQEFNTRVNQIEQLAIQNHQELVNMIYELIDKVDVLEVRLRDANIS